MNIHRFYWNPNAKLSAVDCARFDKPEKTREDQASHEGLFTEFQQSSLVMLPTRLPDSGPSISAAQSHRFGRTANY